MSLQLNPDISDQVEILEAIGCNCEDEDICIEPGESYEVLFKLDVGSINLATSFIDGELEEKKRALEEMKQNKNDKNDVSEALE